ncbi:hypothetical protein HK405_006057 [Cladochytrium tenue]|nr:hypothetical protein HK405_006057 [Cladochytrium tenue]
MQLPQPGPSVPNSDRSAQYGVARVGDGDRTAQERVNVGLGGGLVDRPMSSLTQPPAADSNLFAAGPDQLPTASPAFLIDLPQPVTIDANWMAPGHAPESQMFLDPMDLSSSTKSCNGPDMWAETHNIQPLPAVIHSAYPQISMNQFAGHFAGTSSMPSLSAFSEQETPSHMFVSDPTEAVANFVAVHGLHHSAEGVAALGWNNPLDFVSGMALDSSPRSDSFMQSASVQSLPIVTENNQGVTTPAPLFHIKSSQFPALIDVVNSPQESSFSLLCLDNEPRSPALGRTQHLAAILANGPDDALATPAPATAPLTPAYAGKVAIPAAISAVRPTEEVLTAEERFRRQDEELLRIDFDDVTVTHLKELLRERGLPSAGRKAVLVERVRDLIRINRLREEGLLPPKDDPRHPAYVPPTPRAAGSDSDPERPVSAHSDESGASLDAPQLLFRGNPRLAVTSTPGRRSSLSAAAAAALATAAALAKRGGGAAPVVPAARQRQRSVSGAARGLILVPPIGGASLAPPGPLSALAWTSASPVDHPPLSAPPVPPTSAGMFLTFRRGSLAPSAASAASSLCSTPSGPPATGVLLPSPEDRPTAAGFVDLQDPFVFGRARALPFLDTSAISFTNGGANLPPNSASVQELTVELEGIEECTPASSRLPGATRILQERSEYFEPPAILELPPGPSDTSRRRPRTLVDHRIVVSRDHRLVLGVHEPSQLVDLPVQIYNMTPSTGSPGASASAAVTDEPGEGLLLPRRSGRLRASRARSLPPLTGRNRDRDRRHDSGRVGVSRGRRPVGPSHHTSDDDDDGQSVVIVLGDDDDHNDGGYHVSLRRPSESDEPTSTDDEDEDDSDYIGDSHKPQQMMRRLTQEPKVNLKATLEIANEKSQPPAPGGKRSAKRLTQEEAFRSHLRKQRKRLLLLLLLNYWNASTFKGASYSGGYSGGYHFNERRIISALVRTPDASLAVLDRIMLTLKTNDLWNEFGIYEAVLWGNRELAATLITRLNSESFNLLHKEVLTIKPGEDFTPFRAVSILKKPYGNFRVTPLHFSASNPDASRLQTLLSQVAPTDRLVTDELGRTVVHFAACCTGTGPLEFLRNEIDMDFRTLDKAKMSPLLMAAKHGRQENVRIIIDKIGADNVDATSNSSGLNGLHFASHYGHINVVKVLLDAGAKVDIPDKKDKSTALMESCKVGHIEIARILLERGADPYFSDKLGRTALHHAAKNGYQDIVHLLLRNGADADAEDTSSNTPLHYACAYGWMATVKLLIAYGANVNSPNNWRTTPLMAAEMKGHIAITKYLLDVPGVDANFVGRDGFSLLHKSVMEPYETREHAESLLTQTEMLLARAADPNVKTVSDDTTLHLVCTVDQQTIEKDDEIKAILDCKKGSGPVVRSDSSACATNGTITDPRDLMDTDADVRDLVDVRDPIDVDRISRTGQFGPIERIATTVLCVQRLLSCGTKIDEVNADGRTPLAVAIENKNFDLARFLLNSGASPAAVTFGGGENLLHGLARAAVHADAQKFSNRWSRRSTFTKMEHQRISTAFRRLVASVFDKISEGILVEQNYFIHELFKLAPESIDSKIDLEKDFKKNEERDPFPESYGRTALHLACSESYESVAETLLSLGANPNVQSVQGRFTPLHVAMREIPSVNSVETPLCDGILSATENTVDDSLKVHYNAFKVCVLGFAKLCTTADQRLNIVAKPTGHTILMSALQREWLELASCLVERGAEVDAVGPTTTTTIVAVKTGNLDAVRLVAAGDLSRTNADGETAVIVAIKRGDTAALDMLLDSGRNPNMNAITKAGESALSLACQENLPDASVARLLSLSAAVDFVAPDGRTPIFHAILHRNLATVQELLRHGASVRVTDADGDWLLHYAVRSTRIKILNAILGAGADPNACNRKLVFPLHVAVEQSACELDRSLRLERALLDHGANVNSRDAQGRTPLFMAFEKQGCIPKMRVTSLEKKKWTAYKKAAEKIAGIKEKIIESIRVHLDENGTAREDEAFRWMADALVQSALRNEGAVIDDKRSKADEYVHGSWWDSSEVSRTDPIEIVDFLLSSPGIDVGIVDAFRRTALHYAAMRGTSSSISRLVQGGIPVDHADADGNRALQLALMYGKVDVVLNLAQSGASAGGTLVLPGSEDAPNACTNLRRALSKNYMPVAYIIKGQGTMTPLQIFRDAVCVGKYSLALATVSSASAEQLREEIDEQGFLHGAADFRPTNSISWDDDYVEDIWKRLLTAGLEINARDSEGRSPLVLAAKNGQTQLCLLILSGGACDVNVADKLGNTALIYAALGGDAKLVDALLALGAILDCRGTRPPLSLVRAAVDSKNTDMLRTLLEAGADPNLDEGNEMSALMAAVNMESIEAIKLLLGRGANPGRESFFVWNDPKTDKKLSISLAPILLAAEKLVGLTNLLNAGADPNVVHPVTKRTPLMIVLDSSKSDLVILDTVVSKGADVNALDPVYDRTCFNRALLGDKGTGGLALCETDPVVRRMAPLGADVSTPDLASGETPIDLAIASNLQAQLEFLIRLGANPNVRSSPKANPSLATALLRAIQANKPHFVRILVDAGASLTDADREGLGPVHYVVRPNPYGSFNNIEMLEYLAEKGAPIDLTDANVTVDISADAAAERKRLEVLADKEAVDQMHRDAGKRGITVEQIQKELAKESEVKPHKKAQVDESQVGVLHEADDGEPYNCKLHKCDVSRGIYGENKFYVMQVLYNRMQDVYFLFNAWGGLGNENMCMHQQTPFQSKNECVAEFKKIFKSKTGNDWDNRHGFTQIPGKYILPKNTVRSKVRADKIDLKSSVLSNLAAGAQDIVQMFVDSALAKLRTSDSSFGSEDPMLNHYLSGARAIPESKVVNEAYEILQTIREKVKRMNDLLKDRINIPNPKTLLQIREEVVLLSNEYYRRVPSPHNSLRPLLDTSSISQELVKIENLRYLDSGATLLLAAANKSADMNPLDYITSALECSVEDLAKDDPEADVIRRMAASTGLPSSQEVTHVLKVSRATEIDTARVNLMEDIGNRQLLWHGSRMSNFLGILKSGLRVAPVDAATTGYMFGRGIYFADVYEKSAGYTGDYGGNASHSAYSCLLLCDVAIGEKPFESVVSKYMEAAEPGTNATKGLGKRIPDDSLQLTLQDGANANFGPLVEAKPTEMHKYFNLNFNEYIVYDPAQVRIRYVVVVKDNGRCHLCSQHKQLHTCAEYGRQWYTKHLPEGGNNFQRSVVAALLAAQVPNLAPASIWDQYLDEQLLAGQLYRRHHNPATRLVRDSRICKPCGDMLMLDLMEEFYRDNLNSVPGMLLPFAPAYSPFGFPPC